MNQEFDPRDLEPAMPQREPRRRGMRLAPVVLAVVALAGFGGIVYYAYDQGARQSGTPGVPPLIKADGTPNKVKPDDPGGMDVPHQDKLVLNNLVAQAANGDTPKVERLLPPPETPLPRPAAPPQAAAPVPAAPAQPAPPQQAAVQAPPAAPVPAGATARVSTVSNPPAQVATQAPTQLAPPPAAAPQVPVKAAPVEAKPTQTAAAAPIKASPVAPSAGGSFRVQLASVRSAEAADAEWARLQKTNPELSALKMTTARVDLGAEKGVFFRIQAGPLSDAGTADRLCDQLKQKHQGCMVVRP